MSYQYRAKRSTLPVKPIEIQILFENIPNNIIRLPFTSSKIRQIYSPSIPSIAMIKYHMIKISIMIGAHPSKGVYAQGKPI